MGILAVRSQHSGRPLVVRYLVQGRSGQVESGLEGGSPIEEAVGGAGSGLIGLHLEGMRPGELFTVYQGYEEQEPRPHLEAWRTPREPGLLLQKRALTWNQRVAQPGPRGRRLLAQKASLCRPAREREGLGHRQTHSLRGVGCRQSCRMQTTESSQAGLNRKAFIKG